MRAADPLENEIRSLVAAIEARNDSRRAYYEHGLGHGPIADLLKRLRSGNDEPRRWAILVLENYRDPGCLPVVRECLCDEHREIRQAAIRIVGELQDRQALETLHRELQFGAPEFRLTVVEALGGIADSSSAPLLCNHLV